MKKIAIFCSDDAHCKYLISYLSSIFFIEKVFIEKSFHQRINLLVNFKFIDFFYSIYHTLRRKFTKLDKYRDLFFRCDFDVKNFPITFTRNINSKEVRFFLEKTDIDCIIVSCTSILNTEILSIKPNKFINIHGGYLPVYRGNHCIFFAVYNRDYNHLGSTIHFINTGIDTGDIIKVIANKNTKIQNSPEKVYCQTKKEAIHELATILKNNDHLSDIKRQKQEYKKRLCRTRDRGLLTDLNFWLIMNRRKTKSIINSYFT